MKKFTILIFLSLNGFSLFAQSVAKESVWHNPGVLITITLILVPLVTAVYLAAVKVNNVVKKVSEAKIRNASRRIAKSLDELSTDEIKEELIKRKQALDFKLSNTELAGKSPAEDKKGLLHN